jgi:hypothetical protein
MIRFGNIDKQWQDGYDTGFRDACQFLAEEVDGLTTGIMYTITDYKGIRQTMDEWDMECLATFKKDISNALRERISALAPPKPPITQQQHQWRPRWTNGRWRGSMGKQLTVPTREEVDDEVCRLMIRVGPDGHVDGHDDITDYIMSLFSHRTTPEAPPSFRKAEGNERVRED